MRTHLESCDVFDQDIFWMALCGRQGREDDGDEMEEACRAGIGLALCIWVEDCIWLTRGRGQPELGVERNEFGGLELGDVQLGGDQAQSGK
jgi:hypothetical protein